MPQQAILEKDILRESSEKESSAFWNLYANCQDNLYHLMPYRKLLWDCLQTLDLKPSMKLLNANCGTGNFEIFLAEKRISSVHVEAITRSPEKLLRAKNKCSGFEFVRFSEADALNLISYEDNYFDRIICKNVFFPFAKVDHILSELYRILKPSGKLVLVNPINRSISINALINDHLLRINNIKNFNRKITTILQSQILLPRARLLANSTLDKAHTSTENQLITSENAEAILKKNKYKDVEIFLSNAGQNWIIAGNKNKQVSTKISKHKIKLASPKKITSPKVRIRLATDDDIDDIHKLEISVWGKSSAAPINQIKSRISIFPKGNLIAEVDNTIVGHASFMLLDYDKFVRNNSNTWYKLTDNGYMTTHENNGKDLFAINLCVIKEAPRSTSKLLIIGVAKTGAEYKAKRYMLGSRIPSFYKYCNKMKVEEYVNSKSSTGRCLDPELDFYRRQGLKVKDIVPNYFKDPQSKDFGIIIQQENPFSKMPLKLFSKIIANIPLNTVSLIDKLN